MRNLVDLRSDTVTLPTASMRRAMAQAEVGDDVYGEDPTINRLEERMAQLCDKEAGLFVPSGTMGNLVAILTHCGRGEEVLLGATSHAFAQEQGALAALGGIHAHSLNDLPDGTISLEELRASFHAEDDHLARTRLISLENTHNLAGGRVLPLDYLEQVWTLAREQGVPVHLDGARLFNAAVALGLPLSRLAAYASTASICLSKGLACPLGSVVVGSRAFITEARRNRKLLGGGMRQAGIVAAAGLVALDEMIDRLAEDHANARVLAEGLAEIDGLRINPRLVETNILFFEVTRPEVRPELLVEALADEGVRISGGGFPRLRMVTHYGIEAADIEHTLGAMERALAAATRSS